jgi:hypothetical protein
MAVNPILARFQIKRDTTNNWTTSQVRLQSGEPGYDVELKILKIGDGNTLWNNLQSISSSNAPSGGGPQYDVVMTVNSVIQDSVINLRTTYTGVEGNGSIRLLRGNSLLYTENINLLTSFAGGSFAFNLPVGTYLEHSTVYNIEVLDESAVRVGYIDGYAYNPPVSLNITNVFVSSDQGIGITYTYLGPKINDMNVELRIQGSDAVDNTMIIDIDRTYVTPAVSRTIYLMKTSPDTYNTDTFNLHMANEDESIIADFNNFSYTKPEITNVYFVESNNKKINVSFNTAVIISEIIFTIDPVIGSNTTTTVSFATPVAAMNYPNNTVYSGSAYPIFRDSITTSVKFIDGRVLQYSTPLLYQKQINAQNPILVRSNASVNYNTLILPNVLFSGFTEVNVTLYRIESSSETEVATYTISSTDNGVSGSSSGSPTIETFTTSTTYNKAVNPGDIEYNKNYKLYFYNSDNVALDSALFGTSGTITTFNTKVPVLSASAGTISSIAWSNSNATPKPLITSLFISTDTINPVGNGTFNPTANSITVTNDNLFVEGSIYYIKVQLPDGSFLTSRNSAAYEGKYVEPSFSTSSRLSVDYLWFSTYDRIVLDTFTAVNDESTTGTTDVGTSVTINKGGASPPGGTTSIGLASGLFVYDGYYIIKGVYSINGASPLTVWSNPIHYIESSATISNLAFPTPSNVTGGTASIAGLPTETRYFTQILEHLPTSAPSISTNSLPLSNSSVFDSTPITTIQSSVGLGTISGTLFTRSKFYACRLYFNNPTIPSPVPVLLATCPNSIRFNPSDIVISDTVNLGSLSTSIGFDLEILGPQIAYTIQLFKNATSVATKPVTAGGGTATYIDHDFQIEASTSSPVSDYYLYASMPISGYSARVSRFPAAPNHFNYTYDSTTGATAITSVAVRRDSSTFISGDGLDVSVRWKGFAADGYIVLLNSSTLAPVRYLQRKAFARATTNTLNTFSGPTYSNALRTNLSDIPDGTYIVRMYLNNNTVATNDTFIQAPSTLTFAQTSCVVSDISYSNPNITIVLTWSGNANSGMSLVFRNPSVAGNIVSVNNLTTTTNSYTYNVGVLNSAITYSLVITLPSGSTVSTTFKPVITNMSVYSDIDSNTPTLGSRTITVNAVTSVTSPSLQYILTTSGTTSGGAPTTVFTSTNQILNSASERQAPFVFNSSNFIIGHFYKVTVNILKSGAVIAGGTVNTTNKKYDPAGYDILLFSGQSNMVGRDDGESYEGGNYYRTPIPREKGKPPLYTDDEKNDVLVDRNGNNVKSVQVGRATSTVGLISDYKAAQKTINIVDSGDIGVTQSYDFTRLYAANVVSSNRRVGVVFAPRGAQEIGNFSRYGGNYSYINLGLDRFDGYTVDGGSTTFNCNRVVAFVWHQGESDSAGSVTTWANSLHALVKNLISDVPGVFKEESLNVIAGNIDLTHLSKVISRPTRGEVGTFVVPNLIDAFSTINTFAPAPLYKRGSYSSLGLLAIDPDSRIPTDFNDNSGSGTDVHFSARSERLFGLRAFNRFANMNSITGAFPQLAQSTVRQVDNILYDTAYRSISFDSPCTSHENSVNPVAYLVSVNNVITRTATTTNSYFIFTESNSKASTRNPSGVVTNATIRTCYIPYLPSQSETDGSTITVPITSGSGSSEITTNTRGIIKPLTLNNDFNNIPNFSTGAAYSTTGTPAVTAKRLYSSFSTDLEPSATSTELIDYIEWNAGSTDTIRTANLAESKLTISIQTIYTTLDNLNTGTKKFKLSNNIPFVPVIGQRILEIDESPSGSSVERIIDFPDTWVTSPNLPNVGSPVGGSSPTHLVPSTNAFGGGSGSNILIFAGIGGDLVLKTATFSAFPASTHLSKTYKTVGIATTSTPVLNANVFTVNHVAPWNFTNRIGLRYLYQYRGLDFTLFFSESQFDTTAVIPSGVYNSGDYATNLEATQFVGVATEESASRVGPTGSTLQTRLGLSDPARYFTIYGTGGGFITKIRNMRAGETYIISYYISARNGRVPYGPNNNRAPYYTEQNGYIPFLTNPLPVRLYTQSPLLAAGPQPMQAEMLGNSYGQDVYFDSAPGGTSAISRTGSSFTTQYLHARDNIAWNGEWTKVAFRITMPASSAYPAIIGADNTYSHNEVYLKFGPIPTIRRGVTPSNPPTSAQREHINTAINIGAISIERQ